MARDRLYPRPWQGDYIQLRALRAQIAARVKHRWAPGAGIDVLDVGCRERPYERLLAPFTTRYTGVDIEPGVAVDVVASAEALPFPDRSFDCVLCTQVLQYLDAPMPALVEMGRVLAPDGMLFLSVPGVGFAGRGLADRWRWTHNGIRWGIARAGGWTELEVLPAGGVLSASAYLIGGQAEAAAHRLGVPTLAAPVCLAVNAAAWNADRLAARLFPDLPPDVSVNYLAVATRAA